jgi:hypothetical protein
MQLQFHIYYLHQGGSNIGVRIAGQLYSIRDAKPYSDRIDASYELDIDVSDIPTTWAEIDSAIDESFRGIDPIHEGYDYFCQTRSGTARFISRREIFNTPHKVKKELRNAYANVAARHKLDLIQSES